MLKSISKAPLTLGIHFHVYMQIGSGDVSTVKRPSSLNAVIESPQGPITGFLSEDAANLAELHPDWQDLVRRRALRSIISIPICGTRGVVGCLTLGCFSFVRWEEQWWYGGLKLLSGWATSMLSLYKPINCLDFFEQLNQARDLGSLASAIVNRLPSSLHGEDLGGKVETRLALVSSTLTRAMVYSNEPLTCYNSREELCLLYTSDAADE